jgi:hypothetical protein
MKNKYLKLIVIAYIAINILGVIVYYTMPKGSFVQVKVGVDSKQFENSHELLNNPQVLADKSLADKYNIKNYNFNYKGKDLEITFAKEQQLVFIDRKTSDDNKIEVYWYSGPIIVDGIDFSNILKEPNIKMVNNKLNIENEKQKYKFTQFSKDLVIDQFYEKKDNESNNGVSGSGSGILYMKIPKNLKVVGDEGYQYINN